MGRRRATRRSAEETEPTVQTQTEENTDQRPGDETIVATNANTQNEDETTASSLPAEERAAFLKAAGSMGKKELSSVDAALQFLSRHQDANSDFSLVELLQGVSASQGKSMWTSLYRAFQLFVKSEDCNEEEESFGWNSENGRGAIRICASLIPLWFKASPQNAALPSILKIAKGLHSILIPLWQIVSSVNGVSDDIILECDHLVDAVSDVCIDWWKEGRKGKEHVVTSLMPVLLMKSLTTDARMVDVARVNGMSSALRLFDIEDESSATLKQLLLMSVMSPNFMKSGPGKNFVSSLFALSPRFVPDLLSTLKAQLPFIATQNKTRVLDAYAEVYFKAWKAACADEECLAAVESGLQNLFECAIVVADPALRKTILRIVNSGFSEHKMVRGVDAMMLKLVSPFLWRSLSAANPEVRKNATVLLSHCFPLQDPSMPVAEVDELLQKQLKAFEELLSDPAPSVRVVATQGASRILSIFWDIIPGRFTTSLLTKIVGDLSQDGASADVRTAVLDGLAFIMDNPVSQSTLKEVLPHTGALIHDRAVKVRSAMARLLCRIKSVRSIKFYNVVDVDDALKRLALDKKVKSIALPLTRVLLPSFYPQGGAKGAEQLRRALSLIKRNPLAADAFFSHLKSEVSVGSVCKLCMMLGKWIVSQCAKGADGKRKADALDDEDAGGSSARTHVDIMTAALDSIVTLWASIKSQLERPVNAPAMEHMRTVFSFDAFVAPILGSEIAFSKEKVLEVAGMLPCDDSMFALKESLLTEVLRFRPDVDTLKGSFDFDADLGPIVRCLCLWGAEAEVLNAAKVSFDNALSVDVGETLIEADGHVPRRKRKRDRAEVMHPMVAVWATAWVFADSDATGSRGRVFSPAKEAAVDSVLHSLALSKDHMKRYLNDFAIGGADKSATYSTWFLSAAMELHTKTLIHRFTENLCSVTDWDALVQGADEQDEQQLGVLSGHLQEMESSVTWCLSEALPLLRSSKAGAVVKAARSAVLAVLSSAADSFQLGLATHASLTAAGAESSQAWEGVLNLCTKIVDSVLYELHTVFRSKNDSDSEDSSAWMSLLCNVTCKILICAWKASFSGSKRFEVDALIRSWLSRMKWSQYGGDLHSFISSLLSHNLKSRFEGASIIESVVLPLMLASLAEAKDDDLNIDNLPELISLLLETTMRSSAAAGKLFSALYAKVRDAHASNDAPTLNHALLLLGAAAPIAPKRARGSVLPKSLQQLKSFGSVLERPGSSSNFGGKGAHGAESEKEEEELKKFVELTIARLAAHTLAEN